MAVFGVDYDFTPTGVDTAAYIQQNATPSMRACIIDIEIGSGASLDNAGEYTVRRATDDDTGATGSTTPRPFDPLLDNPTFGAFQNEPAATAPTYTASVFPLKLGVNQRATHRWCALPNRGIWLPATANHVLGLEVTAQSSYFAICGYLGVEE